MNPIDATITAPVVSFATFFGANDNAQMLTVEDAPYQEIRTIAEDGSLTIAVVFE